MFNRARFCFLESSFCNGGDDFRDPRRYEPLDHRFTGVHLEAELCSDGVWRVLACEPQLQLEEQ